MRFVIVFRVFFYIRQNKFEDRGFENVFIVFFLYCVGKMLVFNNYYILDLVYIRKFWLEKL